MTAYSVSGTLTPDATTANTGEPAGTFNGQDYWTWTNDAGTWYLLFGTSWRIYKGSLTPPPFDPWWNRGVANILGEYSPVIAATGTATVAEYVPPVASVEVIMGCQGKVNISSATGVTIGGNVVFP